MLRPTLLRAARVHTPLIRFPDRRAPKGTHAADRNAGTEAAPQCAEGSGGQL